MISTRIRSSPLSHLGLDDLDPLDIVGRNNNQEIGREIEDIRVNPSHLDLICLAHSKL